MKDVDRRLTTILVADVVGSTAAMEADEEAAVVWAAACLDRVTEAITEHDGKVFNTAGDALLAEFPSPVNALRAAMKARAALSAMDGAGPEAMRFGLHLADVLAVGTDLRGDGVNLAARIQSTAEPGAIEVSGTLYEQVRRNSPCYFDDLGERRLAGISDPVRVLRVKGEMDRHRFQPDKQRSAPEQPLRQGSIAILPLKTASSADEDQTFLAEGLREDLTLELSRLRGLYVSSKSAALAAGKAEAVEAGHLLGVAYVLSGSLRRAGSQIRLNLSLTSTTTGDIVWSERIQRPFDALFDVMDQVVARVAATVAGRVELAELTAARLKRPETMSAYEAYLRGVEHHRMGGVTIDHAYKAVNWLRRSRALDPNFARPYSLEVCAWSYLPEFDPDKGEKLAARALELDPTEPEANRIMGMFQLMVHRDYEAARRYHERAIESTPNDAYILSRCAAFYTFDGEPERALDMLDRAETLDPFLPVYCTEERVAALYALGRYEKMLSFARGQPIQTRRSRLYRAAGRIAFDDKERAEKHVRDALALNPDLSCQYVRAQELYRDQNIVEELVGRCRAAGLPETPQAELVAV